MVVISLAAAAGFRAGQGRKAAFRKTIAIRPDAKTGNRNWPCRELNIQRTLNPLRCRSRFGEGGIGAAQSRLSCRRHFIAAELFPATPCWIGKGH